MTEDPQEIWNDYFDRIKRRRLAEAAFLWDELEAAGANEDTVLALDFAHFGNNREDADGLAKQLSENYAMEVKTGTQQGYWAIEGTTRPEGVCLTRDQHTAWVEFMVEVARSYACVFNQWTLEVPALGRTFQSAHLDID